MICGAPTKQSNELKKTAFLASSNQNPITSYTVSLYMFDKNISHFGQDDNLSLDSDS